MDSIGGVAEQTQAQLRLPDFGGNMEWASEYLERKSILSKAHEQYLHEHPALRDLLSDYLQTLLLQKPTDVYAFTRDHFSPSWN